MEIKPICGKCIFFNFEGNTCHRHAPTPIRKYESALNLVNAKNAGLDLNQKGTTKHFWPEVETTDFCGEFKNGN